MKTTSWFRGVALCAALTFFGATTLSCAYVLHPERRGTGRHGGRIDTLPLVLDCLWLIPGIIPGVVALVVDFTSGAIYGSSSLGAAPVKATGKVVVKVPPVAAPTRLALRLLGPDGQVLDQASALMRPGDAGRKLVVDVAKGRDLARAGLQLEISGLGNAPVRIPVATN